MGKFIDFVIDYNEDPEVMGRDILTNITCNRLRANKPCIIFIGGDSGEGKSYLGLKIVKAVNDYYGLNTLDHLEDAVVVLPNQYLNKLDNCLFWQKKKRDDLKDLHVLMIDEARDVVKARNWYSFLNNAIADCNAMSRKIKPMVLIVISQFIKDIDNAIRYTITFYVECQRPLTGPTRVQFERVWKNTYDLDRPKLCKRPLVGYIDYGNRRRKFYPRFEAHMPPREIYQKYDELSFDAKSKILRKKIEDAIKRMNKDIGNVFEKVDVLVDAYMKDPDQLRMIKDPKFKKFRLRKDFRSMHDLTDSEVSDFQSKIIKKLDEMKLLGPEEEPVEGQANA